MRIIVVEDERTTRNGIVNLIGRIDGAYQVVATADDGTEGLEKNAPCSLIWSSRTSLCPASTASR